METLIDNNSNTSNDISLSSGKEINFNLKLINDASILNYEDTPQANIKNLKYHNNLLKKNKKATCILNDLNINNNTVDYFQIGLNKQQDSIRLPIMDRNGNFTKKSIITPIDGFLPKEIKSESRAYGLPLWLFNQAHINQRFLIVADNHIDFLLFHQSIIDAHKQDKFLIICSSHTNSIPKSGTTPIFYDEFKRIYITHGFRDNTNLLKTISSCSGDKAFNLKTPVLTRKSADTYINHSFYESSFLENIENSEKIRLSISDTTSPPNINDYELFKDYSLNPVDISGIAYNNGFMYYPIMTHYVGQNTINGKIGIGHSRRIIIVRSPKRSEGIGPELLEFNKLDQVIRDDTINDPLYVLSDGTLLDQKPRVSRRASWEFDSIKKWVNGDLTSRDIDQVLNDIINYYKSQFHLPIEDDYTLLGLATFATHCQQAFKAVPLLLATGPAGSGKSTMGFSMTNLCANPEVFGQVSPATLTRAIDENRGFAVLDDMEKVANQGEGFGELEQALKVSYNRHTAIRPVTIMKGGDGIVRKMNFFGIKLFNNTRGIESIIGSRTLTIHTQKAPKGKFQIKDIFDPKKISDLRNELHIWSFEYINEIVESYNSFPTEQRIDEITAPLKAIANLSKNSSLLLEAIDRIIDRHNIDQNHNDDPEEILKEAVYNIFEEGFKSLCLEHVLLEMLLLVPENWGKNHTTEIPEWQQTTWIKRKLRGFGWIHQKGKRARISRQRSGSAPIIYDLNNHLLLDYTERYGKSLSTETSINGQDFCRRFTACKDCKYQSLQCPLIKQK